MEAAVGRPALREDSVAISPAAPSFGLSTRTTPREQIIERFLPRHVGPDDEAAFGNPRIVLRIEAQGEGGRGSRADPRLGREDGKAGAGRDEGQFDAIAPAVDRDDFGPRDIALLDHAVLPLRRREFYVKKRLSEKAAAERREKRNEGHGPSSHCTQSIGHDECMYRDSVICTVLRLTRHRRGGNPLQCFASSLPAG